MVLTPVGDHAWVFDLVAEDGARRQAALERHRLLIAAALDGQRWINDVWARAGTPVPADPHLAAEMARARSHRDSNVDRTIFGPIDAFLRVGTLFDWVAYARRATFVMLFLRWEALFPGDWRHASEWTSPWTIKESVLAVLARQGVPSDCRADVEALVIMAVHRSYRCKDWRYAPVARHVDSPAFRQRIPSGPTADPRARFLHYVLANPTEHITRTSYRRWRGRDSSVTGGR